MMKFHFSTMALPVLAAVLAAGLVGCPPPPLATFEIKLTNTGEYAITGAYYSATEKDWGVNLLTAPLASGGVVIIPNLPYQHYDFRCTFDGNNQEGNPAALEQLDNWPPGQGADCVTWEAAYSANGDWFIGYSWGCTE